MKQIDDLWQVRLQSYIKELRRYLKYMFNDHLIFVLVFGGGAMIYYYSNWVKALSSSFPIAFVMAVVLGVVLSSSPIHTLLKEADIVYLLPLERKLQPYFQKAIRMSFLFQAYIVVVVLAAFMPMYVQVSGEAFNKFFLLLAWMLIIKYWNISVRWQLLKFDDRSTLLFDRVVRFAMSAVLVYFIVDAASIWMLGAVILIMLAYTLYFREAGRHKLLKWQSLIEKEQERMQLFYRMANMFTDVPHLKGEVKRRKWLDFVFSHIPYGSEESYRFLFARSLVRTAEFSGLVIRLTAIAAVISYLSGQLYFTLAIALLFLYLTGFQLLPLYRRHELKLWPDLYPIQKSLKQQAVVSLIMKVLLFQAIIFGIGSGMGSSVMNGLIVTVSGIVFAVAFSKLYAVNRLSKQ